MAQRTVALCNGKYIGIETIYTVVNGAQINIPEKLMELRAKSRNNELFCPCGCGANLVLVAGDKNLREQHFRIKDKDAFPECEIPTEGETSIDSKIVLKCWLDDNLHTDDLESRVPISAISDSKRKYEFTFISRSKKIALNYCHDRANLSDEKLSILEENAADISIIHIADTMNSGSEGQYPEGLMKMQNRQGYCLLLSIDEDDYNEAELEAMFYAKDLDGIWQENWFASGLLKEFRISDEGQVFFKEENLATMLAKAQKKFADRQEKEKERRIQAEKERREYLKQLEEQREKEREEREKQRKLWEEEREKLRIEEERRREEELEHLRKQEEKRLAKEIKRQIEERQREEDFKRSLHEALKQQKNPVVDPHGDRWFKCEFCDKIGKNELFLSYGGPNRVNIGICYDCARNNPKAQVQPPEDSAKREKSPYGYCPKCGCKLVKRNGRRGSFIGCSGYPLCDFTDSF